MGINDIILKELKSFLAKTNTRPSTFANKIGVAKSSITRFYKGEFNASGKLLDKIANGMAGKIKYESLSKAVAPQELTAATYKFRTECFNDVSQFIDKTHNKLTSYSLERWEGFPDVEFTFTTDIPIAEIENILLLLEDSHVMVETLAKFDEYTGERL